MPWANEGSFILSESTQWYYKPNDIKNLQILLDLHVNAYKSLVEKLTDEKKKHNPRHCIKTIVKCVAMTFQWDDVVCFGVYAQDEASMVP